MKRTTLAAVIFLAALFLFVPAYAEGPGKPLPSGTGNILRGEVYKQSGMVQEGVLTIRTSWKLPGEAPVLRYDFDVLHGTTEGNLYSFMLADVAEMTFLPMEAGAQPVNMLLRNGLMQKTYLTAPAGILGNVNLRVSGVDIISDEYGETVVRGGDVAKIVFAKQAPANEASMALLVERFDKALKEGKRDKLIDDNLLAVLRALQAGMKSKIKE